MVEAATIRETLQAGRLIEAGTLLTMAGDLLTEEERRGLHDEVKRLRTEAEALLAEAEQLEKAGQAEEARRQYEAVQALAVDFPGIDEHIKRMDESLFLAQAVRHRSRRIRSAGAGALMATPKKKRGTMWALVLGSVLVLALVFLLVPGLQRVDQVPAEKAVTPTIDQAEVAALVEAEPVVAVVPEEEAAPVDGAYPMDSATPVAATVLPVEPAEVLVAEISAEPVQEPEPAVVVIAGEESPPLPDHPVPGAREADAVVATETEEAFFLYTVQPGDTLGGIAVEQLCRFWAWRDIYTQNRGVIGEPEKLPVGTVLRLDRRDSRCPPGS